MNSTIPGLKQLNFSTNKIGVIFHNIVHNKSKKLTKTSFWSVPLLRSLKPELGLEAGS